MALDSPAAPGTPLTAAGAVAALDAATRAIASLAPVDEVLQLIVDQVRTLMDAQYAALGIVGESGDFDLFITSGLTPEQRTRMGAIPHGRGLLGLIITEGRSYLVEDLETDARRYGIPDQHPEMHAFLGAPVRAAGEVLGNLYLTNKARGEQFDAADLALVETFATHAGIAIANARLHEQVQRLVVVDERERISRDLHDGIIQSLYAVGLSLEDVPELMAIDSDEAAARLERAIDAIHVTIRDIRNFILGLRPELLDAADLAGGIGQLAAELRANTMLEVEWTRDAGAGTGLDPAVVGELIAITREALSNAARHSRATRVSIHLGESGGALSVAITDDGVGFDPDAIAELGHHGLGNIRSRAAAIGATLSIEAGVGEGTRLVVTVPSGPTGDP